MRKNFKSIAIVALLGLSTLLISSASASVHTIAQWAQLGVIREGDKDFRYFGSTNLPGTTEIDIVSIGSTLHVLTVDFATPFAGTGILRYSVAINSPPNTAITSVGLDSDTSARFGTTSVTKDVHSSPNGLNGFVYLGTFVSSNGAPPPDFLTGVSPALGIIETFRTTGFGRIFSASNSFTQDFGRPVGGVPEPASCLIWAGLASVGFFASRRNRKA